MISICIRALPLYLWDHDSRSRWAGAAFSARLGSESPAPVEQVRAMRTMRFAALCAAFLATTPALAQQGGAAPRLGANEIAGTVTGPKGPEAGVWVIAETTGLPTRFAKIVVTDAQGRYLIPELPKAQYSVWVRGYGLVDSAKVQSTLGKTLDLTAVPAPSPAAAAEYYPAIYWYAMLKVPPKSAFGAGLKGSQEQWLDIDK